MEHLEIPDSLLEELRCSVCKDYLSSAPVQVLPDGKSICSTCAALTEQPTQRELTLESLLNKLLFPCRFKQYGCKGLVPFGQAAEHEGICSFQPYSCPSLPSGSCTWKGSVIQIFEHFTSQHVSLVQEKLEFELQVDKDEEGILMTMFEGVPLIMKYKYSSSTSSLHHDVRLIALNKQEGTYKIQLTNDLDHDYSIATKGGTFLPYNNSFNDTQGTEQNWKVLITNNFLQNLNNPSCVTVAVNAAVSKFIVESNEQPQFTVDYKLIQSLRCKKCRCYLIPPVFQELDVRTMKYIAVCFYCQGKFGLIQHSTDDELKNRVANANFPCRWRGCEFVEKGNNILEHELICQFRIFKCRDCDDTFMWEGVMPHLQSHGYEYVTDKCVYKTTFSNVKYDHKTAFSGETIKKMFTFKNKDIVYILHNIEPKFGRHRLQMCRNDGSSSNIIAKVELEHAHCKIKSKIFKLNESKIRYIKMWDDLPACFKQNEELTVTLKIEFVL